MVESERSKMLRGALYDAGDPELMAARRRAKLLCQKLNVLGGDRDAVLGILRELLPNVSSDLWIEPPFYCDYGDQIVVGADFYANHNCVVLDVCPVTIGAHVMLGPNVQIYTAMHPMDADDRRGGLESGKPVRIGNDCWIGGSAVICPGVTIGARCVIGAGAVVTRDIPADCFAAGNPARVLRHLDASDESGRIA